MSVGASEKRAVRALTNAAPSMTASTGVPASSKVTWAGVASSAVAVVATAPARSLTRAAQPSSSSHAVERCWMADHASPPSAAVADVWGTTGESRVTLRRPGSPARSAAKPARVPSPIVTRSKPSAYPSAATTSATSAAASAASNAAGSKPSSLRRVAHAVQAATCASSAAVPVTCPNASAMRVGSSSPHRRKGVE